MSRPQRTHSNHLWIAAQPQQSRRTEKEPSLAKAQVVEAHRPGKGPKFTRVEMTDMQVLDHGAAAVVTCQGTYEGPQASVKLKFLRVWLKQNSRWQIIAGSISN